MQTKKARPTVRCLEDLQSDWESQDHARGVAAGPGAFQALPPLSELEHPIIRHAAQVFHEDGDSDLKRESISGLTDPAYWKVKTGRWRGAIYEDPDGQYWLVAAGLRYEGESKDFYKEFMQRADTARGREQLLPTAADRQLLRGEQQAALLTAWEEDLRDAALDVVEQDCVDQVIVIKEPGGSEPVATASISVESYADNSESVTEVTIRMTVHDWRSQAAIQRAEIVLMTAIWPHEQEWSPGHLGDDAVYCCVQDTDGIRGRVQSARTTRPGSVSAGTVAHYADLAFLGDQMVDGTAAIALCGTGFVPRQDHVVKPVCASCKQIKQLIDDQRIHGAR